LKTKKAVATLAAAFVVCVAAFGETVTFPPKTGAFVTDTANVILPAQRAEQEKTLHWYRERTSITFDIVTVPSFDGLSAEAYGKALFARWKMDDRGVILLAATGPLKPSGTIVVGNDLRTYLSDGTAKNIGLYAIDPSWDVGKIPEGIDYGMWTTIKQLGTQSYSDRMIKAALNAKASQMLKQRIEIGLFCALGVVLFFFGRKVWRELGPNSPHDGQRKDLVSVPNPGATLWDGVPPPRRIMPPRSSFGGESGNFNSDGALVVPFIVEARAASERESKTA
jgi:uncharacterized membrane protein YgcG